MATSRRVTTTLSFTDPRAQTLYVRHGLLPHTAVVTFEVPTAARDVAAALARRGGRLKQASLFLSSAPLPNWDSVVLGWPGMA